MLNRQYATLSKAQPSVFNVEQCSTVSIQSLAMLNRQYSTLSNAQPSVFNIEQCSTVSI